MNRAGGDEGANLLAALLAVACTGIFAIVFASGRFAADVASPLQLMFLRYAGGFITIVVVAAFRRETVSSLRSAIPMRHFFRAGSGAVAGCALLYGNAEMPIVDVAAISLLSPVFMVLLGISLLGDRLSAMRVLGMAVSAGGAAWIIASRGAFTSFEASYLLPAAVVVAGAFMLAVEGILIKVLATADRPLVTLAHVNLFGTLLLAIPAALTWRAFDWTGFVPLLLGPLALFGQYLNIRANMLARVSVLAPLSYTSLVFAALIGWALFGELPTSAVVVGALVIVIGGAILALSKR
ncbi:MAG: DMT family transporter [Devosia sp.]